MPGRVVTATPWLAVNLRHHRRKHTEQPVKRASLLGEELGLGEWSGIGEWTEAVLHLGSREVEE